MALHPPPERIELIGNELALAWPDGREDFLPAPFLRSHSPSAESKGEPDLFGRISGGTAPRNLASVRINGFDYVGNYAARLVFSDGHDSGIFSWEYLREIADEFRKL
ncbi:MAG: hypothetical protein CMI26_02195 [Opitutae bacterium]|nr:hypothetical protein [Opitutae bacterium]